MLQIAKKVKKMEIKNTLLFQSLNTEEIQRVLHCSNAKFLTFDKHQEIISPEDRPEVLYLILKGKVILEQFNYMGKPMNIEYRKTGELFAQETLFLENDKFDYSVRATEPCKILTANKNFFFQTCEKSCEHHSKVIYNMLHIFALENRQKQQRLELLTCGELEQRVAWYLLEISNGNPLVSLSMNRNELAAYLNVARPSLSRTLSSMQEQEIIQIQGRNQIHILDFENLQALIDGISS